jgi:hypothetical protein
MERNCILFSATVSALQTSRPVQYKALKTCRAKRVLFALAESASRMATDSRRLSILTSQEIDDLFALPRFTENDRRFFFDLNPAERDLVDSVHTISVAVHLILQLGHFKAKRQFFVYLREDVLDDLEHIRQRYFPAREIVEIKTLSKPTRLEQPTGCGFFSRVNLSESRCRR